MTDCECPASGYCKRHNVHKTNGWHELCRTKESYFRAWENGIGPGQRKTPKKQVAEGKLSSADCWKALHEYAPLKHATWNKDIAISDFSRWESTIPSFGCPCKANWPKAKKAMPPVFDTPEGFFEWTVSVHNLVSVKHVSPPKNEMPLNDAYAMWWPEKTKHQDRDNES